MAFRNIPLILAALTTAPALAGPMAPPSEIAPRRDVAAALTARREAAEAGRSAIRPAAGLAEWEGDRGMDRTLRLLEPAERVEGIKAMRRGWERAPDGDAVGSFGDGVAQGALPAAAPPAFPPPATNPWEDAE